MKRIRNKVASLFVVCALAATTIGVVRLPVKALAETRTVTEADLADLFKVTDGKTR